MSKNESIFTDRDFKLLAAAMTSLKSDPVIDYAKFATKAGFKNANSAKTGWYGLKKKMDKAAEEGGDAEPEGDAETTTTAKKAGGKKRKAAAAHDDNEDDADAPAATVKPKAKRGRKAKETEPSNSESEMSAIRDAVEPTAARNTQRKAAQKGAKTMKPESSSGAEEEEEKENEESE